jgi:CcmD family protein
LGLNNAYNLIHFLAPAFGLLWLLFVLYAWSLARRQSRLRREIEELKTKLPLAKPSGASGH